MDEERFNISVRKFLKEVGVTSQREIEKAVWDGPPAGTTDGIEATMTLEIPALGVKHVVRGHIQIS